MSNQESDVLQLKVNSDDNYVIKKDKTPHCTNKIELNDLASIYNNLRDSDLLFPTVEPVNTKHISNLLHSRESML